MWLGITTVVGLEMSSPLGVTTCCLCVCLRVCVWLGSGWRDVYVDVVKKILGHCEQQCIAIVCLKVMLILG